MNKFNQLNKAVEEGLITTEEQQFIFKALDAGYQYKIRTMIF
jgi:hypothetical protein